MCGRAGGCAASQLLAKWGHRTTWSVRNTPAATRLVSHRRGWEGTRTSGQRGVTWPNLAERLIIGPPLAAGERDSERKEERECPGREPKNPSTTHRLCIVAYSLDSISGHFIIQLGQLSHHTAEKSGLQSNWKPHAATGGHTERDTALSPLSYLALTLSLLLLLLFWTVRGRAMEREREREEESKQPRSFVNTGASLSPFYFFSFVLSFSLLLARPLWAGSSNYSFAVLPLEWAVGSGDRDIKR